MSSSIRNHYETLIRRCFVQLTEGCGKSECTNPHCATGSGRKMDQNEAAAKALTLVHKNKKMKICVSRENVKATTAAMLSSSVAVPTSTPGSVSGNTVLTTAAGQPVSAATSSSTSHLVNQSFLLTPSHPSPPSNVTDTNATAISTNTITNTLAAAAAAAAATTTTANPADTSREPSRSDLSQTTEPMETAQSVLSVIENNHTHSLDESAASSVIANFQTGRTDTPPTLSQHESSFAYPPSSGGEGGSIDASTSILSSHSSNGVAMVHMPSVSSVSSNEVVGMELSPSVPSGPSFNISHPAKDELASSLPLDISHMSIPGLCNKNHSICEHVYFHCCSINF